MNQVNSLELFKPISIFTSMNALSKIGIGMATLMMPFISIGQARVNLNDDVFVTINNGAYLVVDNPNANAITTSGAGGNIVSEGEANKVKWNVANSTGSYTVPFTTTPVSQGGNGTKIPATMQVTSAGSNDGSVEFSTYETATDANTGYPTGVTNLDVIAGTDGSLNTVDRFWIIEAGSYSTKPDVTLSFSYDDAANEIGNTNTISEANLVAQRYNTNINTWEGLVFGTVNATNNTVSGAVVGASDFYGVWTLSSNTAILPVENLDFTAEKMNESALLKWNHKNTNALKVEGFEIERSGNGQEFEWIGQVNASEQFEFTDAFPMHGNNYYRLKLIYSDGSSDYSVAKTLHFGSSVALSLYPNPTSQTATLNVGGMTSNVQLTVFDIDGRLVAQSNFSGPSKQLDFVQELANGMYYLNVQVDDMPTKTLKLVKQL